MHIYKKQYSIGQLLSIALEIYKNNFKSILIITLIIYLPINIILGLMPVENLTDLNWYWRVLQILEGIVGIIATMAICILVKKRIDKKQVTLKQVFDKALARWVPAITTTLITGLFLAGLTLLLIVPGIIFYIYWMFIVYIIVLNDKSNLAALRYSKEIVKGRWWRVFGYSLTFFLLSLAVGFAIASPFWVLQENYLISVLTDTINDIALAYFTVVASCFYINFEATRKKSDSKK